MTLPPLTIFWGEQSWVAKRDYDDLARKLDALAARAERLVAYYHTANAFIGEISPEVQATFARMLHDGDLDDDVTVTAGEKE